MVKEKYSPNCTLFEISTQNGAADSCRYRDFIGVWWWAVQDSNL